MHSSQIEDLSDIGKQVQRFAALSKLGGGKPTALLPTSKGLRLSQFETGRNWHEPARLPRELFPQLPDGMSYWIDSAGWLQIIKSFGKKNPVRLELQEGLLLFNDEKSQNSLEVTIGPYPETTLKRPEKPEGHYRLKIEGRNTLLSLRQMSRLGSDSPVLPGILCRSREAGLEWLAGDGGRMASLRIPAEKMIDKFQQGIFDASDLERIVLALEAEPELEILCGKEAWLLQGPGLHARIPFQNRKWPQLGFMDQKSDLSFVTQTKEMEQVLKTLVPPASGETLPTYRLEVLGSEELRFSWFGGRDDETADQGRLAARGILPAEAYWQIRSDILKDLQKVLKGKVWTWGLIEGPVPFFRVESDNVTCWFCPMLDDEAFAVPDESLETAPESEAAPPSPGISEEGALL